MRANALGRKALLVTSAGGLHHIARFALEEGSHSLSPGQETMYIVVCIALIVFSGLCAGLTLGLLSLDR
jgi:hypothetical protein